MSRRLVAAVACRNNGSRLYGKPLQNLDVKKGIRIIDYIIDGLMRLDVIDEIILGISEGVENDVFKHVADEKGLRYITGDQVDVLSRLVQCGQLAHATDVFRITSESPFFYFEAVDELWNLHQNEQADATFMDEIIDGCGFEIISQNALEISHQECEEKHKEPCTLYIREHIGDFKILKIAPPQDLIRYDLRLTVDNPEDLAVCRTVYEEFSRLAPRIPLASIIEFLDDNPRLIEMIAPFVDAGYATMYL